MTLDIIRPGVAFRSDAAASFRRMETQQKRRLDVNRSTASEAEQMVFYTDYQAYLNGGAWAVLALHPSKTLHVYREDDERSATAWDTDERGDFLEENGWIADVRGEPWHREYRAHLDQHRNDGEWDEMATKEEVKQAAKEAMIEVMLTDVRGGRTFWGWITHITRQIDQVPEKVWNHDLPAQDENGKPIKKSGKPVTFKAWGYLSSAVAQIQAIRTKK